MKRSPACDSLVKLWEGYHRALPNGDCEAYPDVAHGWSVTTIGFGTTGYDADARRKFGRRMVRQGDTLTRAEAESELDVELDEVEESLGELIKAPVTQSMFDAMCSFAFNLGIAGSAQQISRINAGKYEECARSFDLYVNANGRPFQGLINRRNDEEALFRKDGMIPGVKAAPVPEQTSYARPYELCPLPLPWNATLRTGEMGLTVYQLQCALIGLGYLDKPTGLQLVGSFFNKNVEDAVKKLQYAHDLFEDGIVGPSTRLAIAYLLTAARAPKATTPVPTPEPEQTSYGRAYVACPVPLPWDITLSIGGKGLAVYHLQCALIGLGYLARPKPGDLVGDVFNEHVEYAVKKLKYAHDLFEDGIVGPATQMLIAHLLTAARALKTTTPTNGDALLTNDKNSFYDGAWAGLRRLSLQIGDDTFSVASGARGAQTLRRPQDPRSTPGNLEPIPQGRYVIGAIEFANGKDNYEGSWGHGLGPMWVGLDAEFSDDRGAFGFHQDHNIGGSPGSAGCVVFRNVSDLKRFVSALRKHKPKHLSVEWGL